LIEGEKVAGVLTGLTCCDSGEEKCCPCCATLKKLRRSLTQSHERRGRESPPSLMNDGALASHACKIVSEFNDKMVRRVITLTEKDCGLPPSPMPG